MDYVGYGPAAPRHAWPDGARLALSFAIHFQEGAERSPLDGDDGPEGSTNPIEPRRAARDLSIESLYEFGSRVGIWRLLDLLDEFGVRATFFCAGRALERNPVAAEQILVRGHEVAGHGYRWVPYVALTAEEERADIQQAVAALEAITGQRPKGWHSRAASDRTRGLLAAEGFVYDSDSYDDDVPHLVSVDGTPFLTVPHTQDTSDIKFWPPPMVAGYSAPDDFFRNLVECFDRLYAEGAAASKMMTVSLRLRISGHPSRANQVRRFLQYVQAHPDVWITTRSEIATSWLERQAANGGTGRG